MPTTGKTAPESCPNCCAEAPRPTTASPFARNIHGTPGQPRRHRHRPQPRRPDRDRRPHHRRRPGGAVPGVRAGPAGDQGARDRLADCARRPADRAVPRQADLRHPRHSGVHRAGADRCLAQANRALWRHLPPGPDGDRAARAGRRALRGRHQRRHALHRAHRVHRRRRGRVRAALDQAGRAGRLRGQTTLSPRARPSRLCRQEPLDCRRRRLGPGLGAQLCGRGPQPGRQRDPAAPPRRLSRGAGQRGAHARPVRAAADAVHGRPGHGL